jgi:hypothetical protein
VREFVVLLAFAASAVSAEQLVKRADFNASNQVTFSTAEAWIGKEQRISVGEKFFESANFLVSADAIMLDAISVETASGSVSLPAGTVLKNFYTSGNMASTSQKVFVRDGKAKNTAYLSDADQDYRFDTIETANIGAKKFPIGIPARYSLVAQRPSSDATPAFSWSLTYLGTAGGILRVGYREFSNDLARPAFSNDLTFPAEIGKQTTLRFKNLALKVLPSGDGNLLVTVTPS